MCPATVARPWRSRQAGWQPLLFFFGGGGDARCRQNRRVRGKRRRVGAPFLRTRPTRSQLRGEGGSFLFPHHRSIAFIRGRMRPSLPVWCLLACKSTALAPLSATPVSMSHPVPAPSTVAPAFVAQAPDYEKYPCIPLAYEAGRRAGSMTCALNAANEKANELFRGGYFDYFGIPNVIEATMAAHEADFKADPTLDDIIATDEWARRRVLEAAERERSKPILL